MSTRYYEWIVQDSILQSNETPTLIMVGADDRYAGINYTEGARVLANTVAGADFVIVPGDHLSAPRSPEFLSNMLAFLAENNPGSTQN